MARPSAFPRNIAILAVLVLAAVLGWRLAPLIGDAVFGPGGEPRTVTARGALAPAEASRIELFETARESVVYVQTAEQVRNPWTRSSREVARGTGSGFFWDDRGHVVTNNHVIAKASSARIRLADGRAFDARLVGTSPETDLAVLGIDTGPDAPPPLPIGRSDTLQVGQTVLAIGNPYGLDWTLSTGVISALDRTLPGKDAPGVSGLIQTDAAINPGNSGGPLLDSAGRLIGVNSEIYSPSGASAGISFAIPVDTVNRVVPQIIEKGSYTPPRIGIEADQRVNGRLTARLDTEGVLVLATKSGSPAEAAGLTGVRRQPDGNYAAGDVITAVDGTKVATVAAYLSELDRHEVGDSVELTVWRDGKTRMVEVPLQAAG